MRESQPTQPKNKRTRLKLRAFLNMNGRPERVNAMLAATQIGVGCERWWKNLGAVRPIAAVLVWDVLQVYGHAQVELGVLPFE